jgi:hypothetical protein
MRMWKDFSDFELAELAGKYGIEDNLLFASDLSLINREEIENELTLIEHEFAFGE